VRHKVKEKRAEENFCAGGLEIRKSGTQIAQVKKRELLY
jgi:hypothetical protein